MLRGENIVCGTSTTGTGTLTLAATPVAPGGVDFDVLARATGIGFGNSAAVLVSYTITEYTDATFSTAKSTEKGIGTLTLGGSSGIANCTLARTTVQVTATNLNSQPATYNTNAPSAVSIGTAANVLVFVGASAADLMAYEPYFETGVGDNLGVPVFVSANGTSTTGSSLVSGTDWYLPFDWYVPMLVKKASMRTVGAYTGGTPVSNAYGRIYAINSSGRPGKLLLDLGLFGSSNVSLNTGTANVSTAVHASGFFLTPGRYFFDFLPIFSGGVTAPTMLDVAAGYPVATQIIGATAFTVQAFMKATSGNSTAPDPANVTGYAAQVGGGNNTPFLALAPS